MSILFIRVHYVHLYNTVCLCAQHYFPRTKKSILFSYTYYNHSNLRRRHRHRRRHDSFSLSLSLALPNRISSVLNPMPTSLMLFGFSSV